MKLEKITLQDVSDEYIRDDPFTDVRNVLNAVDELSAEPTLFFCTNLAFPLEV